MKGEFEISEMTLDDLEQVCRIESEAFPNPWPKSAFEEDIRSKSIYCPVVKTESSHLIGYACLMIVADEAHLTNIAVLSDRRRTGIGSVLMDDLVARAACEGCRVMYLEVRPSNLTAIRFYSRYGFTELYRRKRYYQKPIEDALVMACAIGERECYG